MIAGAVQRRPVAAAKAYRHAGPGQLPYSSLRDGCPCAQQDDGSVGDRNIPVARLLSGACQIFYAPSIDDDTAMFKIINICTF